MKQIYILGAGGFSKEVLFLIEEINKVQLKYEFKGFIVDSTDEKTMVFSNKKYPLILQSEFLQRIKPNENISIAIGIGNPNILTKVTEVFSHFDFPNLIHPNFTCHKETFVLNRGNIVTAGCSFTVNINIGSFNIFNLNTTLGHDCVIGNYNVFNPGVNLSGGLTIGSRNLIGTGATVLQNLSIGTGSILGAGALLTKSIENNQMAIGVPAKVVKNI